MKRFAVRLCYDGSEFHGWQIQQAERTVQQTIEECLTHILKEPVRITGSGRTDAGVHALEQWFHCDLDTTMKAAELRLAMRSLLPPDILILEVRQVSADFHARFSAFLRTYQYRIATLRTPFNRRYASYQPRWTFNIARIRYALTFFTGPHDFISFCKTNPDVPNTVCDVKRFTFFKEEEDYVFEISADRFLHNMVRRIVGCVMTISTRELDPEIIARLIALGQGHQQLIPTAPPNGLFLTRVAYPPELLQSKDVSQISHTRIAPVTPSLTHSERS